MGFYIPNGHALSDPQDSMRTMVLHVLGDRVLIFFDYLRLKLPFTITWYIQFHVAIADMYRFLGITITAVIRFFVTITIHHLIRVVKC